MRAWALKIESLFVSLAILVPRNYLRPDRPESDFFEGKGARQLLSAGLALSMHPASTTHRNIRTICELEKAALAKRSVSARVGDAIATQAGRMWFIILHIAWFFLWVVLNAKSRGGAIFDPFPYSLLTMIVSLESIFLSLFILMSQNRSGLQADQRNHLDLQINLLSEDENTKMLQMLQALCEHHNLPIAKDAEITVMAKKTELRSILEDLKENLPGDE